MIRASPAERCLCAVPLGEVLHKDGKLDEADGLLRSSLEIRAKTLGEGNAATQAVLQELVAVSTDRGSPRRRRRSGQGWSLPRSESARETLEDRSVEPIRPMPLRQDHRGPTDAQGIGALASLQQGDPCCALAFYPGAPFSAASALNARPPSPRRPLPAALLWTALTILGRSASAQTPPPETKATEPPTPLAVPQPFPLLLGLFDLSGAHTFPAAVTGTSGRMGSTFITGRIAPVFRVGPKLYLSLPLDGSISFYDFRGDPGLLPGGGSPWDQVRIFAIGLQGRYRIDDHWVLLTEINAASAGARGARFGDTLSTGATFGTLYRFGPELTVGLLLTAQTRLARGPLVLPVPASSGSSP